MSNIYIQEPPTNGKVLLKTSVGDIDVELWPKEAPKACRNFVQLCLEGYYDNTIFHRIIRDFIAQAGDPTGTGEGGQSIYGKPFKDEIHTRLRFVRRGLVAMANAGKDDNGSQFFFTLAQTPELQGKHTIFAKVAGETVYNMIKLNDIPTDETDRPATSEPPKIKKTEVLLNPFDDIVPREKIKHEKEKKDTKSKSKGKKDFKLLSFGEEAEEEEEEIKKVSEKSKSKGKSAHELANDPKLSMLVGDLTSEQFEENRRDAEEQLESVRKRLQQHAKPEQPKPRKSDVKEDNATSRTEQLRREAKQLQRELQASRRGKPIEEEVEEEPEEVNKIAAEYKQELVKYENVKKMIGRKGTKREDATLAILENFKTKMSTVKAMNDRYGDDDDIDDDKDKEKTEKKKEEKIIDNDEEEEEEEEDDPNDTSWLSHKLRFGDAHSKVIDANVTDVDRYEIYDPRNPMVQRRREDAKKSHKKTEKVKRRRID